MQEKFYLDQTNVVIKEIYGKNNYKVNDIGFGNTCYIFFSSNGIYFPNTQESFIDTIVNKDRYEWSKVALSEEVSTLADKIIFVRDVYKQYYVNGINQSVDSIDKLCELLSDLTEGMKVITCGTSSGGYIATIVGIKLNADRVFNFAGQWNLFEVLNGKTSDKIEESFYFLDLYKNDIERNKYYNLSKTLEPSQVPIFYFYSAMNEGDIKQVEFMPDNLCIYAFAMKSKEHGWLLFNPCYRKILTKNKEDIIRICRKYKGKVISQRKICFDFLDVKEAVDEVKKDIIRSHKILQRTFER